MILIYVALIVLATILTLLITWRIRPTLKSFPRLFALVLTMTWLTSMLVVPVLIVAACFLLTYLTVLQIIHMASAVQGWLRGIFVSCRQHKKEARQPCLKYGTNKRPIEIKCPD